MAEEPRSSIAPPPVWGHEELRASLRRAVEREALPATLLIHGLPGAGKQSLAQWLARTLLCTGVDRPCGTCTSCRLALRLEHPDIHWYIPLPRPRGASSPQKLADALEDARYERLGEFRRTPLRAHGGEEVKGLYLAQMLTVRRHAHRRPAMGDHQVFIIGDAEYLVPQEASPEAANALLKLLEEPPTGSRFILTSSRPGSLLETIRSRALPIHLPPLSKTGVATFLEGFAGASPEAARDAAALSQGSIGLALGHLDPDGAQATQRDRALRILRAAVDGRRAATYGVALGFGPSGARGLLDLMAGLQVWIRDLGAVSLGREDAIVNADELPFLRETAQRLALTPERTARAVDHVEEARMLALGNVNPQLLVSTLLLDLENTLTEGARP